MKNVSVILALVGACVAQTGTGLSATNFTAAALAANFTTEVVTAFTTVCPSPTTFSFNNKLFTVTNSTTLTITDCPCTRTRPVNNLAAAPTTNGTVLGAPTSAAVAPAAQSALYTNGTAPSGTIAPGVIASPGMSVTNVAGSSVAATSAPEASGTEEPALASATTFTASGASAAPGTASESAAPQAASAFETQTAAPQAASAFETQTMAPAASSATYTVGATYSSAVPLAASATSLGAGFGSNGTITAPAGARFTGGASSTHVPLLAAVMLGAGLALL